MSLEQMFMTEENIQYISKKLKTNARNIMENYIKETRLDDYESVTHDFLETLNFINISFIKNNIQKKEYIMPNMGDKYPICKVLGTINTDDPSSYGKHDAQYEPDVIISNANFRYDNRIRWVAGLHRRNYDKSEHEKNLIDRELYGINRGYNMDDIYRSNDYSSSVFL